MRRKAATHFLGLSGASVVGDAELVVDIRLAEFPALIVGLDILLEGLAPLIRIQRAAGPALSLLLASDGLRSMASVQRQDDGSMLFEIGTNQARYVRGTLLRACLHQMADVNHLHLEGREQSRDFDLTLVFDLYREPMTPDEAKGLLSR